MDTKPVFLHIKDLGKSLATYRLSRNMRQGDVAKEAGVSRGVVARLESGQGGTVDSLIRVLKALDLGERIASLVPDAGINPLDRRPPDPPRQRARPPKEDSTEAPWTWG